MSKKIEWYKPADRRAAGASSCQSGWDGTDPLAPVVQVLAVVNLVDIGQEGEPLRRGGYSGQPISNSQSIHSSTGMNLVTGWSSSFSVHSN